VFIYLFSAEQNYCTPLFNIAEIKSSQLYLFNIIICIIVVYTYMLYFVSALLLISLYLSTQQVHAAANFTNSSTGQNFTSSSTGQNLKVLIEQAIISLNKGNTGAALSNLTLADRSLTG
jgi:hypothetical protein